VIAVLPAGGGIRAAALAGVRARDLRHLLGDRAADPAADLGAEQRSDDRGDQQQHAHVLGCGLATGLTRATEHCGQASMSAAVRA
jgi:hypothetical protein